MSIALTAVKKMLKSSYFDVTTVSTVCAIIGASNSGPAYDMLCGLHCIHYTEMPKDVLAGIPSLMREVFSQAKIEDAAMNEIFKGVRA
jgi:hypothetical protein